MRVFIGLLSGGFKANGKILDRFPIFINEADTEITQTGAVDDSAANNVSTLVECESL
jgi:hypothetical protein